LITPSGTGEDPSGNSYGWGYNGVSGGWIEESVDLSIYAGKIVQLRFEYVTDAAVNGEGLLLDDISIEAVNTTTDFETDEGGWQPQGFVRVQNVLPQTFRLAWILLERRRSR
jgi:bacillopeptidase F (M6 metalloprotease family)